MPLIIMFTYPTLIISYVYNVLYTIYFIFRSLCNSFINSLFKQSHFYVYIPYITHLICICTYCTRYHLLHLAYAVRPSLIHIFLFIPLHLCVYKVVVVELLDYSLVITALLELEAQAFRYTRINIC